MKFIEIINKKKFTIICTLFFVYIVSSLFEGERGLLSYINQQKLKKQLVEREKNLTEQLFLVEKKNNLLSENLDLDYLEILYRQKFVVGKSNENIYNYKQ